MQIWVRRSCDSLRKTEREPSTHPDFTIKMGPQPGAEFLIRGVRPKVTDDLTIFDRIDPATRYYSVVPLVPGVREVFEKTGHSEKSVHE